MGFYREMGLRVEGPSVCVEAVRAKVTMGLRSLNGRSLVVNFFR